MNGWINQGEIHKRDIQGKKGYSLGIAAVMDCANAGWNPKKMRDEHIT